MGLSCLTLERMLLPLVLLVGPLGFSGRGMMLLDMLAMLCHGAPIHFLQGIQCQFDVRDKRVASCPRKVFTNNNPHELKLLAVRGHGVCRHHPASLAQMMSNGKFIVVVIVLGVQPECYKGQTLTSPLAHDQETEVLKGGSKVIRCAGYVKHNRAVAVLAETNHLVVLANDLGGAFGKVEGERGLIGAKVIDVEH